MIEETVEHGRQVRQMFARIASRYDRLNRLMTLGQDRRWRRETVAIACRDKPRQIVDLGTGTGDLALEAFRQNPGALVVAVDFSPEMMAYARKKENGDKILWVVANGHHLPFASSTFTASVSGFLVRNLHSLDKFFDEQHRILAPQGMIVTLDTTPPENSLYKPFLVLYLNLIVPLLGWIFAGDPAAYQYLRDTTKQFLSAGALEQKIRRAGFVGVYSVKRMFGIIAIHAGRKPGP
jgi:demethylmenaquinone methyltransferase/2-methoxy-6-polyprenyl-1,4-benzoquinol methylase